jgi:hypothetical protein
MSRLASVTDAQRQGLVFLDPDHISSVHEISRRTEISLTVLSFAVAVALFTTIIIGLANFSDALRKKLVRGFYLVHPLVDRRSGCNTWPFSVDNSSQHGDVSVRRLRS